MEASKLFEYECSLKGVSASVAREQEKLSYKSFDTLDLTQKEKDQLNEVSHL